MVLRVLAIVPCIGNMNACWSWDVTDSAIGIWESNDEVRSSISRWFFSITERHSFLDGLICAPRIGDPMFSEDGTIWRSSLPSRIL